MRAETERLRVQMQQQQVQQQQVQQQRQPEQFDNSLAEAMQRQMSQLLEGWSPKGMKQVSVIKPEDMAKATNGSAVAAQSGTTEAVTSTPSQQRKILVSAGTVSYAQLLTEANSDVPGPILAQIVSGPLSGARAVGAFKVSQGYEKYLVLNFTLADKKGRDYSIDAIALDPDTTLGGMATEVDERYMVRVVLPAAAGFLQGMGQALGQGNSSITSNGNTSIATTSGNGFKQGLYNGMGQAANTMGQFFQDQANLTKPLVRVASGTPMGLFFTAPVFDQDISSEPIQRTAGPGNGNGNGYPGTNVNGYGNQQAGGADVPYANHANPTGNYVNTGMNRMTGYSPYGQTQGYGAPGGYNGQLGQ